MTFFQFESDFVESLRCIPMQVRHKLDTCGVKLKLAHWTQFTPEERQQLIDVPCDDPESRDRYRQQLQSLVVAHSDQPAGELPIDPAPAWLVVDDIPATVLEKASSVAASLSLEQWASLTPLQRFALIKLSRPSHENRNFLPALKEFNLVPASHSVSTEPG
jgi:hypothetical protein